MIRTLLFATAAMLAMAGPASAQTSGSADGAAQGNQTQTMMGNMHQGGMPMMGGPCPMMGMMGGQMPMGMMGQGGMMGPGMMGPGMMGPGMGGPGRGMMGQGMGPGMMGGQMPMGMMGQGGMMGPGWGGPGWGGQGWGGPGMMGPGMMGSGMMGPGWGYDPDAFAQAMSQRIEGRLAFLRAELRITDAQADAWTAFADALRARAAAHGEMRDAMMERAAAPPQTTLERLQLRETVMAQRLEHVRAMREALEKLTAALDEQQKQTLDQLLPWAM
jgi:hypothetical protein